MIRLLKKLHDIFHFSLCNEQSPYFLFRILERAGEQYLLQCINKNVVFYADIREIIFSSYILYGLHPIQACQIGIDAQSMHNTSRKHDRELYSVANHFVYRYGKYNLYGQDREGNLLFTNPDTYEEFCMPAREVALSEKLIREFDASQAFYIGLISGNRLTISRTIQPNLYIVK